MNAPVKPWQFMNRPEKMQAVRPLLAAGHTYNVIADRLGAPSRSAVAGIAAALKAKGFAAARQSTTSSEPRAARLKRKSATPKAPAPRGRKLRIVGGVDQVVVGSGPKASSQFDFKARAEQRAASVGLPINRAAAFEPIPGIDPVGLLELTNRSCRWMVNGIDGHADRFCGALKEIEHSYCGAHKRLAYAPPRERNIA